MGDFDLSTLKTEIQDLLSDMEIKISPEELGFSSIELDNLLFDCSLDNKQSLEPEQEEILPGPTRRMLYRYDIFNLVSKEPEIEYDKNETELLQVQEEYGKLLKQWAEMPVTVRETLRKILTEALRDILNNKFQEEN